MVKRIVFSLLVVSGIACVGFGQHTSVDEQLAASRQQIDKIDSQIVELINQRAAVVEKIGAIKLAARLPTAVPHREQEVLRHIADLGASGPFPASRLQSIYLNVVDTNARLEEEQRHRK